jgi:acyl-CoA synthetase (NDP forming)
VKKASADFGGVLIQPMVGADSYAQEIIIGGKKDPQFGQTIAFGLGGVFVEVFEDISFRVVPIENHDAESMMKETKGYKILSGHRGKTYDIKSVEEVLMKTSKLLEENEGIAELDINPLMVLKKGALAVDGRIILE